MLVARRALSLSPALAAPLLRASVRRLLSSSAARGGGHDSPSYYAPDKHQLPKALSNLSSHVFSMRTAHEVLDADTYDAFVRTVRDGEPLPDEARQHLADGLKMWAMQRGAVNYAHWFSALRGSHGAKYDAFLSADSTSGGLKVHFDHNRLFCGETDGSSFPTGGLRRTSRAAAYTAWDISSPPFVREDTLYIPAAFATYSGEPIDDKTPLLRSQDAVDREGVRLMQHLGFSETRSIIPNVGWEQEMFVIDRELYKRRLDLVTCGRTLVGAPPHKAQQTESHYFGRVPLRTRAFLREAQHEMWRLGISFNVMHDEVAPSQHEVSPVYTLTSRAADQNALATEILEDAAHRHGLVCLFHEKPFAGINGSGKHCNWSLNDGETGANLCSPGKTAEEQRRFMTVVAALCRAFTLHGDVLRASIASAGNDHRLGAQEAPPAIICLYSGEDLEEHIRNFVEGKGPLEGYGLKTKELDFQTRAVLPISAGKEDRNRSAPFPFTSNRFEFRAVGSSQNVAFPMWVLNTAIAESFAFMSNEIESGRTVEDVVRSVFEEYSKAIFNGDNYSPAWIKEAKERELWCLPTTVDAIQHLDSKKNAELFEGMQVMTRNTLKARKLIMASQYAEQIRMEVTCMLEMLNAGIIPACLEDLCDVSNIPVQLESIRSYISHKTTLYGHVVKEAHELEAVNAEYPVDGDPMEQALFAKKRLIPVMNRLRAATDKAEKVCPHKKWPVPKYDDILYSHHPASSEIEELDIDKDT